MVELAINFQKELFSVDLQHYKNNNIHHGPIKTSGKKPKYLQVIFFKFRGGKLFQSRMQDMGPSGLVSGSRHIIRWCVAALSSIYFLYYKSAGGP